MSCNIVVIVTSTKFQLTTNLLRNMYGISLTDKIINFLSGTREKLIAVLS